jgi:two-component system response regulator WspF
MSHPPLIAIGSSAGGPAALATILSGLPEDFAATIVVVQHIDENFAQGMAEWLSQQSRLPVRIIKNGDAPTSGIVHVAATNEHLIFTKALLLAYTPIPEALFYRPSIDVFFESVNRLWPATVVGVLLTGMGRDGARGLKALRDSGRHTIAQDEASSIVYGMPKAAAILQAATDILPLEHIAHKLVDLLAQRTKNAQERTQR